MSEDITTIKCKINKSLLPEVEKVIDHYASSTSSATAQVALNRGKLNSTIEFTEFDEDHLSKLNSSLIEIGAQEIQIEFYFDQTNETLYFINLGTEFKSFQSEKEIKQARKDLANSVDLTRFDFGKDSREFTGVIRLLVTAKSKREKIAQVFHSAISDDTDQLVENFSKNLKNVVSPDSPGMLALCDANFVGTKPWQPIFREVLTKLQFSLSQGDYVYIGFNLDDLPFDEYSIEDFIAVLPLVFVLLDGVKKVWIKFKTKRNGKGTFDLFVRWPGNHENGPVYEEQIFEKCTEYDVWDSYYS